MRQTLIVPGKPTAKGRPRAFNPKGEGGIRTFTPEKTVVAENLVKIMWIKDRRPKLNGCIRMHVYCYFKIPKSYSKKKHNLLDGQFYDKLPDVDNLIKMIMDGLNEVAFDDDKQIVECFVCKRYIDGDPYTQIILEEI